MPEKNNLIYVVGSSNTDMVVKASKLPSPGETVLGGDFSIVAGGKGANQAVAAARLGGKVSLVANVGRDSFGDQTLTQLQQEKINCQFITQDSQRPSGVALISVDDQGENHIVVAPGANSGLEQRHIDRALAEAPNTALVLVQLEIAPATVTHTLAAAAKKGLRVILDPAPAPTAGLPAEWLKNLYLITPNETEAQALTGITVSDASSAAQAATKLLQRGVKNVVITLGSGGALLANAQGTTLIDAPQVTAVDSTAAGDCFNGALAVALSTGQSLPESLAHACHCAAISVTRAGAQNSLPYSHEVN